jgi:hypothetical protein
MYVIDVLMDPRSGLLHGGAASVFQHRTYLERLHIIDWDLTVINNEWPRNHNVTDSHATLALHYIIP